MYVTRDAYIKQGIVNITIETTDFTVEEIKALDSIGEPEIILEKVYQGTFPVSVRKKIRTNFTVRQKFDGNNNLEDAIKACNDFYDDIKEKLADAMEKLMDKICDNEFKQGKTKEQIKY